MKTNPKKVTIVLNNGYQLTGEVNILSFDRFSDFIETYTAKHIKLFNVIIGNIPSEPTSNFYIIPKDNILYYEPTDEN